MRVSECVYSGTLGADGSRSAKNTDGSANSEHARDANHVDNRHFDDPEKLLPSVFLADLLPSLPRVPEYSHSGTRITRAMDNFFSGKSISVYTYEPRVLKIPICSST